MLLDSPWWILLDTCSAQVIMYKSKKHPVEGCALNVPC